MMKKGITMYFIVFDFSITSDIIAINAEFLYGLCSGLIHEGILVSIGRDGNVDAGCNKKLWGVAVMLLFVTFKVLSNVQTSLYLRSTKNERVALA